MSNRQNCAKFQENLFRSNKIISIFCPPLFRKRPIINASTKNMYIFILISNYNWKQEIDVTLSDVTNIRYRFF